jgi:hypothetical protein
MPGVEATRRRWNNMTGGGLDRPAWGNAIEASPAGGLAGTLALKGVSSLPPAVRHLLGVVAWGGWSAFTQTDAGQCDHADVGDCLHLCCLQPVAPLFQ